MVHKFISRNYGSVYYLHKHFKKIIFSMSNYVSIGKTLASKILYQQNFIKMINTFEYSTSMQVHKIWNCRSKCGFWSKIILDLNRHQNGQGKWPKTYLKNVLKSFWPEASKVSMDLIKIILDLWRCQTREKEFVFQKL